jgi:hypothetical protein
MGLQMHHSAGAYGRAGVIALGNDIARATCSLVLMLGLFISGAEIWVSVALPVAMYVGLQLFAGSGPSNALHGKRRRPRSDLESYDLCLQLRHRVSELTATGWAEPHLSLLAQICAHIDNSLRAIAEDGTYLTSVTLCELMETTVDLEERYLKVARRGLAGVEMSRGVTDDLASLEAGYRRFWERLNRDAVRELHMLSATIELSLGESTSTGRVEEPS